MSTQEEIDVLKAKVESLESTNVSLAANLQAKTTESNNL
jgi:hypothetical protein